MACSSTATKTSIRHEVKMVSTILKAGGADINDTSLYYHFIVTEAIILKGKYVDEVQDNQLFVVGYTQFKNEGTDQLHQSAFKGTEQKQALCHSVANIEITATSLMGQ